MRAIISVATHEGLAELAREFVKSGHGEEFRVVEAYTQKKSRGAQKAPAHSFGSSVRRIGAV